MSGITLGCLELPTEVNLPNSSLPEYLQSFTASLIQKLKLIRSTPADYFVCSGSTKTTLQGSY